MALCQRHLFVLPRESVADRRELLRITALDTLEQSLFELTAAIFVNRLGDPLNHSNMPFMYCARQCSRNRRFGPTRMDCECRSESSSRPRSDVSDTTRHL